MCAVLQQTMALLRHHFQQSTILNLSPIWILTLLSATAVALLLQTTTRHSLKTHLPPSPRKLPIIGNLHQLSSLPHRSLHALSRAHGPLMLLQLGSVPTLIVSSADAAREIMKSQDHVFANRPSLRVPTRLLYGCRDVVFAPYGDRWRDSRKLCVLHLLSPKRVRSYRQIREQEVEFMVEKIERTRRFSSTATVAVVDVSEAVSSFAKDVISRVAFGKCSREEGWNDAIDVLIEESNVLLGEFCVGDYVPWLAWLSSLTGLDARVENTFGKVDRILEAILEGHGDDDDDDGVGSKDFVGVLLSLAKDHRDGMGLRMERENIKAIMEDLFGAGTDSTIIVLEWCMAELVRNSKAMTKLQNEVRGIVGAKALVEEGDLIGMSYLKAIIKEVLRLHPPGPLLVPRESMELTEVKGFTIPKQTRVIVNAWAIGRDPEFWDSPEEFKPERFIDSPVDFKGHHFQFIPFGSGRRVCPGISLAASVVELALANLVHRFQWKLPPGETEDGMDMHEAPGITNRKKTALCLACKPFSC